MIRASRWAGGVCLAAAVTFLAGCDVPNLAPDETDEVDPGIWNGKPIKQWILQKNDEAISDQADSYQDQSGRGQGGQRTEAATRGQATSYLDQLGPEDKDL